jgi:ferrochelatase
MIHLPSLISKGITDEEWLVGQLGMEVHRAESLNGSPVFIRALADIVAQHLKESGAGAPPTSVQMGLRCPGCSNATCAQQKSFFARGGAGPYFTVGC